MIHFPLGRLLVLTFLTARSRSQSSKMTRGDLPPSSSDTFFRLESAQERMMVWPTSVLPVKPSLRTRGWLAIALPASEPE